MRKVAVTENCWSKALRWGRWRFVHYQPEMFDEPDVGELYDLAQDPNEARNLYADPMHQEVVQQCRRLLLEWLIRTTRVVNCGPAPITPSSPSSTPPPGMARNPTPPGRNGVGPRGRSSYL